MPLTRDTLKPFQLRAADELAQMLHTYPNAPFEAVYQRKGGQPYPFICRLKAITGSGKTPVLALLAATLGDAIILWTTNRGAVIAQTAANLSAGGSYAGLLPDTTTVRELNNLSANDWTELLTARTGLTVLLGTAALFNRADKSKDGLNIHKDRGGTSYWEMLANRGPDPRQRPLYIVYDEAHGTTAKQFERLTELNPRAFVLASASPLPETLTDLLPGDGPAEQLEALNRQTVRVDTREVVKAGLLKTRLYLVDCNTTRRAAVQDAHAKWQELRHKVSGPAGPIWCGVVNSTLAGLEVWAALTELGVPPASIAVHLANVDANIAAAAQEGYVANWAMLVDTKKAGQTPDQLRAAGYTHIIWNLALREGWDEPWAYVAYLDGAGKSLTDISQKIGRFVRQPNATPFADDDLNAAYFYFNVPDEDFATLVQATQHDLGQQGYDVISISSASSPKKSRMVPVKTPKTIAVVMESFGEDLALLDNILLDRVSTYHDDDRKAQGQVRTKVLDMHRNEEDGTLEKVERRAENADVSVWGYLSNRLAGIDTRIIGKGGTRFYQVSGDKKMRQRIQYNSTAMRQLNEQLPLIQQKLNAVFRLDYEPDPYTVGPFNLTAPDLQTENAARNERHKVRAYTHALHAEYNGLNPFEVVVAAALDQLGLAWCRNPSRMGYGIPIPVLGEQGNTFYPDFLLWGKKTLWAIDPKGKHLMDEAIRTKLYGLSEVEDMPEKIRVALFTEGHYTVDASGKPQPIGKGGCTMFWKENGVVKADHETKPGPLLAKLGKM